LKGFIPVLASKQHLQYLYYRINGADGNSNDGAQSITAEN